MVHRLRRLRGRDDGAVTTIAVLLISLVFVGLCALVVDMGLARDTQRQAHNAADASALAAGNLLYLNTLNVQGAVDAAKSYASSNYSVTPQDWADCRDAAHLPYTPDGLDTCISFDDASAPTSVRVNIPVRKVTTTFGRIWGVGTIPVGAAAQIKFLSGGQAQCGLCVIGSGADLQNGDVTITGANVSINGTTTVGPNGGITVSSGSITSLGVLDDKNGSTYRPVPPLTNQPPVADPLINLPMPSYTALLPAPTTSRTNSCPGAPGIYDHLIACSSMAPGLYVLTGSTGGNFNITGNGVTLFLACSTSYVPRACNATGEDGGSLSFNGNGSLNLTAPATGQANQGLSIISDRNNTSTLSFGGNGAQTNSGTIYAARGAMSYNGNGATGSINSLVVVSSLSFAGNNANFVSSYTQQANVTIPPADFYLSE